MPSLNKPSIAITGAAGFLGQELTKHFASQGFDVTALVRQIPSANRVPGVRYKPYDLKSVLNASDFEHVDYFIHCAFSRRLETVGSEELNGFACRQIVAIHKKRPFKKLVYLSSVQAAPDSPSFYGKMKFKTERLFQVQEAVVIRSGLVIGPGGFFATLQRIVRRLPIIPLVQNGNQAMFYVSLPDFLIAVHEVLRDTIKEPLVLAYPTPVKFRDVVEVLSSKKPLTVSIPEGAFAAFVNALSYLTMRRLPLCDSLTNFLQDLSAIEPSNLRRYGIEPKNLADIVHGV